jgi:hypothetical protein
MEHRQHLAEVFRSTSKAEQIDLEGDQRDAAASDDTHEMRCASDLIAAYKRELEYLWTIPWEKRNLRRFSSCAVSLQFGFLLASVSRQALEIVRQFLPFPSYTTIQRYYSENVAGLIADMSDLTAVNRVIRSAIDGSGLPPGTAASLAVDAMSINPDRSPGPGAATENAFVFYIQPLDARFKCFPVHVITQPSGRATAPIQAALDKVGEAAIAEGLSVKYLCADGDSCYHRRHLEFFRRSVRESGTGR